MFAAVAQAALSAINLAMAFAGPLPIMNAFVAGLCACGAMYSIVRHYEPVP